MTCFFASVEGAIFCLQSYPIRDFATENLAPSLTFVVPGLTLAGPCEWEVINRRRVYIAG
jgi:hypothetical protein